MMLMVWDKGAFCNNLPVQKLQALQLEVKIGHADMIMLCLSHWTSNGSIADAAYSL